MKSIKAPIILFLFLLSFSAQSAFKKTVKVQVELMPAGSFQVVSHRVKGRVVVDSKGNFKAKKLKVPVNSLRSGIDLRDEHLRKRIQNPAIMLEKASGKNGTGEATFLINGQRQKVALSFEELAENWARAIFTLSLSKFGIEGVSYMGIGVNDTVKVEVMLPLTKEKSLERM